LKELIIANLEWRRRHLKGKRRQKPRPQTKGISIPPPLLPLFLSPSHTPMEMKPNGIEIVDGIFGQMLR
jgi:hypothetical protein